MLTILTSADSGFFYMARRLALNIRQYPGCKLFLYDLGLEQDQKEALVALGVTLEETDFPADTFCMNSRNNIKTTHKIYCIEHFLAKYRQPVLVLDSDTLIIEDIAELVLKEKNELMVTRRCLREQKEHIMANGKINAGVMAFGPGLPSSFFKAWKDMCTDSEHTDQSALSCLLEREINLDLLDVAQPFMQSQVTVRDGTIYNDVTCRVGKIFHFKSIGRRKSKMMAYKLFAAIQNLFPGFVAWLVRANRQSGLFVWKA